MPTSTPTRSRHLRYALGAIALMLSIAACGGSEKSAPEVATTTTAAPELVTINVEILDSLPPAVYANLDDVSCHAPAANLIATGPPPNVSVEDGSGKLVATQDGPAEGGTFEKGAGCRVPVTITDVPAADIYVVYVTSADGQQQFKANVSRDGQTDLSVSVRS